MRKRVQTIGLAVSLFGMAAFGAVKIKSRRPAPTTETILGIYHVKEGADDQFLKAYRNTWSVYRELDAVFEKPHVLMKGTDESGRTCYFDLFTWKDAEIPDHAPDKIKTAWKELEALCESRGGHRGIEGDAVTIVDEAK
ncbi:MAG TPA: hypothetical protein VI756_13905 [Blastocatellia bacterium]